MSHRCLPEECPMSCQKGTVYGMRMENKTEIKATHSGLVRQWMGRKWFIYTAIYTYFQHTSVVEMAMEANWSLACELCIQ